MDISLHEEAAMVLKKVQNKKASVKTAVLGRKYKNKKQLYAVACETLRNQSFLKHVLDQINLMKREKKTIVSKNLGLVLLYDYLIGKGFHRARKRYKIAILKQKKAIQAVISREKAKRGVTNIRGLLPKSLDQTVKIPRYVRVNTLTTAVHDVCKHFRNAGYTQIPAAEIPYQEYIELIDHLGKYEFLLDPHVKNLMVFASGTDFHDHELYTKGDIILQDKASCIPVHVLAPTPSSHLVDCCAAPGNKTSQAAAVMQNKGNIFAFDLDNKRLKTMKTVLSKAGALCVKSYHQDFLALDPDDPIYSEVKYIIVDPSCSGSGIVNRLCELTDDAQSLRKSRLRNLASFQEKVLVHALSFPAVERVVYSTCSIHHEENEEVVCRVLEQVYEKFHLTHILPEITSRGLNNFFSEASKCLRLDPTHDRTNGFFVACFERGASEPPKRSCAMDNEYEGSEIVVPDSNDECSLDTKEKLINHKSNGNEFTSNQLQAEAGSSSSKSKKIAKLKKYAPKYSKKVVELSKGKSKTRKRQRSTSDGKTFTPMKSAKKRKHSESAALSVTSENHQMNLATCGHKKKANKKKKPKHIDNANKVENCKPRISQSSQSASQKKKKRKRNKHNKPVTLD